VKAIYYVAKLTREGRHWLVNFPDCPGCQTFGGSKREAIEMAADALAGWLASTLKHGELPPLPRWREGRSMVAVPVPARLAAVTMIRQRRATLGLTQKQLAERLGVSQQQVTKIEDPDTKSSLESIEKVMHAVGVRLKFVAEAVART
jgi:predicted RNase H-like HicB family nuclease/DNA-binding XRE family transcriptional regulator